MKKTNWIILLTIVMFFVITKYSYEFMLFGILGILIVISSYMYINRSSILNSMKLTSILILIYLAYFLTIVNENYNIFLKKLSKFIRFVKRTLRDFFKN